VDLVAHLLADLVRIPSVNPMGRAAISRADGFYETEITDYLEHYLSTRGVGCRRQPVAPGRDNLIAVYDSPSSSRRLLFDAHQDTVPVEGMTISPFGAQVEGGRLYGRGACDIKGGLAAMLLAFLRLVHERPRGAASVVLAFTVDEEYTHRGSSTLAAHPPGPVDLAIVSEPTRFDLITSHKGAVRWKIEARGTACHSSAPELGDNAIYRMARVLGALEGHARALRDAPPDPVLGPPSLSIGTIHGGLSVNVVPDACAIEVDRRVIPGEDPEAVQSSVTEALRAGLSAHDFERLEFRPPWVRMPALREGVCPEVLEILSQTVARHIGRAPLVGGVPFGTDAGPLGRSGIACVVLGPGDIAQAHTKDEWIELDQVRTGVDVYFDLACALG
jgi:acetylornithine deacetylase